MSRKGNINSGNENVDGLEFEDIVSKNVKSETLHSIETKNIKDCAVIGRIGRDKVIVDFDNYGLIVGVNISRSKEFPSIIKLEYSGEIGKSDFKYEVVK